LLRASLFALLGGCAAGQTALGDIFREDRTPGPLTRVEAQLRPAAGQRESTPVAINATELGLRGVPLGGGSPWTFDHPLRSRPEISGAVVVGTGAGEVFALRASTGSLLWTRPSGDMELLGAGDDGDLTAVALRSAAGQRNAVLIVGRDGQVLRQLETDQSLGRPAMLQGFAFIPWAGRNVTAYDVLLGREVGRISLRQGATSVLFDQGNLYFADRKLVRFNEALLQGGEAVEQIEIPAQPLHPTPRMAPPARARSLFSETEDRVRAYARPTPPGSPAGLRESRFYLTYHQVVIARRTDGDFPLWIRVMKNPSEGGDVYPGGLALCDGQGHVTLLNEENGGIEAELELGQAGQSCVVQAGGMERVASSVHHAPLAAQALEVLKESDGLLEPLQRELVAMLGRLGDAETTQVLLEGALDPGIQERWRGELEALLGRRQLNPEVALELLRRAVTLAPDRRASLGLLHRILRAQRERRALPLWLELLTQAGRSEQDREASKGALESLAEAQDTPWLLGKLEELRREDQQDAVEALARALRRVGGAAATRVLREAEDDPGTSAAARRGLLRGGR
jgi:tetratricopeptide (TPR) repeat protein